MAQSIQEIQSQITAGNMASIKSEYRRLRRLALKRLARLGESEYSGSIEYRMNKKGFATLPQITDAPDPVRELAYQMNKLQRFVEARGSSVTGQRSIEREKLSSLHKHGYTFVNKGNIVEFGQFMDFIRSTYPHRGSGTAADASAGFNAYKHARRKQKTPAAVQKQFEQYLQKTHPESGYLTTKWEPVRTAIPKEWR